MVWLGISMTLGVIRSQHGLRLWSLLVNWEAALDTRRSRNKGNTTGSWILSMRGNGGTMFASTTSWRMMGLVVWEQKRPTLAVPMQLLTFQSNNFSHTPIQNARFAVARRATQASCFGKHLIFDASGVAFPQTLFGTTHSQNLAHEKWYHFCEVSWMVSCSVGRRVAQLASGQMNNWPSKWTTWGPWMVI